MTMSSSSCNLTLASTTCATSLSTAASISVFVDALVGLALSYQLYKQFSTAATFTRHHISTAKRMNMTTFEFYMHGW